MTNEQIITEIAIELYGEDKVNEMISEGEEPPLHTLQGWALRGYKVKKGEHAVIETKLWKKRKKADKGKDTAGEDGQIQNEENPTNRDFCLCRAFLFCGDQVEKVKN